MELLASLGDFRFHPCLVTLQAVTGRQGDEVVGPRDPAPFLPLPGGRAPQLWGQSLLSGLLGSCVLQSCLPAIETCASLPPAWVSAPQFAGEEGKAQGTGSLWLPGPVAGSWALNLGLLPPPRHSSPGERWDKAALASCSGGGGRGGGAEGPFCICLHLLWPKGLFHFLPGSGSSWLAHPSLPHPVATPSEDTDTNLPPRRGEQVLGG